jgi:hypothetical protein
MTAGFDYQGDDPAFPETPKILGVFRGVDDARRARGAFVKENNLTKSEESQNENDTLYLNEDETKGFAVSITPKKLL